MSGGFAVEFVTQSAASQVVLLAAALTAAGVLLRYLYRAFKMGETAFVEVIGTKDEPSLRATLTALAGEVSAVKKELHPNGGSSMRDELRKVQHDVTNVRAGQELLVDLVDTATNASARAAQRAEDTARQVENVGETARKERADIVSSIGHLHEQITTEAAERYADALELMADHGGPDLRPHLPPVVPHVHILPEHSPETTSGPIPPTERKP